MPFDLGSTIRKTSQWSFSSPFLNNILGSSLFVSVVITLLVVLLIMIMYPAKKGTPFSVICKLFIYMFFCSLLVIFLHDSVLKFSFEEQEQEKEDNDFMKGTTQEGKDIVYNQTPMVVPLGNAKQELLSQRYVPPIGAPVNNTTVQGGTSSDGVHEEEFINIVEGGNEQLVADKAPPPRGNLFK